MRNNPNTPKGFPDRYRIFEPRERARIIAGAAKRALHFNPEVPLAPSEFPKHPERRDAPQELPFGEEA